MTDCPRKPRKPTSIGITWHIQPFSMQSACSVSNRFFFCSCASSWFSSQGTVNSMRSSLFFESDHATMSRRFSVWIMLTRNYRDVLRSTETFQSLSPFSSFMLGFFRFLTGHSPSLRNWIMSSLAVTGCWFAVLHCALNNSMTTELDFVAFSSNSYTHVILQTGAVVNQWRCHKTSACGQNDLQI